MSFWPKWNENKPFALALLILLAYAIVLIGMKISFAGTPEPQEHSITVQGDGRASAVPDKATVYLGVRTQAKDVPTAQEQNTKDVNAILAAIKKVGLQDEDLQTQDYSVYEQKEWNETDRKQVSAGWVVSQRIKVRIWDQQKIAQVLAAAAQNGVTDVSGPNFEIDDPSNVRDQARDEAIADAHRRAKELADKLGVRLVRVINFSEYQGGGIPPYYAYDMAEKAVGMGGGAPVPEIVPGSDEVKLQVSVTYLIR